jgi:hypothetical protein
MTISNSHYYSSTVETVHIGSCYYTVAGHPRLTFLLILLLTSLEYGATTADLSEITP